MVTVALLFILFGLLNNPRPVYATPAIPEVFGSLSGRIVDSQGQPLAGIVVELYRRYEYSSYTQTSHQAITDSDGRYRIALIVTGIYVVHFRDPAGLFTTQYYPSVYQYRLATDISISGNALIGVDDILQTAGRISGLVTTTADLMLGPVEITLYTLTPTVRYADMQTLDLGEQHYQFGGLRTGVYAVCATSRTVGQPQYFFQECYDDILVDDLSFHANPITVTAGTIVSDINFTFGDQTNLVSIDGIVMAADGRRLPDIVVTAQRWWNDHWFYENNTKSAADGTFQLAHLLPGRYALGFSDPARAYVFQHSTADPQLQNVLIVDLPQGGDHTVVTATLVPGAQISGVITLQGEAFPSLGRVILYPSGGTPGGDEIARAEIDPLTGQYILSGLVAGSYQLYATDYPESAEFTGYYGANQQSPPTDILLGQSEIKQNINFALYINDDPYRGLITGTVTTQQRPLAGIKVQLFHHIFDGTVPFAFTFTDAKGNYRLDGLPRDGYFMGFSDPQDIYASIFYPNQRNVINEYEFLITGATTYTNVNADLVLGGIIEGHVYRRTGEPVADAQVIPYWREEGRWYSSQTALTAFTDETGYYRLPALMPDSYRLGFYGWIGHPTNEFYDNAGDLETATDIVVQAGSRSQVDIILGWDHVAFLPLLQR